VEVATISNVLAVKKDHPRCSCVGVRAWWGSHLHRVGGAVVVRPPLPRGALHHAHPVYGLLSYTCVRLNAEHLPLMPSVLQKKMYLCFKEGTVSAGLS
jgi:hypothetical protein